MKNWDGLSVVHYHKIGKIYKIMWLEKNETFVG